MPKVLTRTEREQLHQRRKQWLLANPELWQNWSCTATGLQNHALQFGLVSLMKKAGVVAHTTYALDVNMGSLILEARKEL